MKMKKRVIMTLSALFLTLAAVTVLLVVNVNADPVQYNLWIGGDRVTSENLSGDGWKFEPETNTLVLNGFGLATWGYYKFVGYLDIDPTQCHPNYTADIREGVAVEYVSCEPTENLKELFPEQYGEDDDSFEEEETEQA